MSEQQFEIGHCPVCERDGVPLRPYLDRNGRERIACDDEHACCAAHAKRWAAKAKTSRRRGMRA